ncbi:hypothetical protein ORJ04_13030 [Rheinheimera baltica]|uniref:Elongation factor P C-terminal domain-containing protein n=1 Tax=Rheinheimera baltica TaxID=67576 RepID=A0ABT9I0F0_9GAMM|nr:hypothetical protein [Rheinheimera baltica]
MAEDKTCSKAFAEPAARSDTSGKVLKPAKIETGFELMVPAFVEQGDKIEIDTGEFRSRDKSYVQFEFKKGA